MAREPATMSFGGNSPSFGGLHGASFSGQSTMSFSGSFASVANPDWDADVSNCRICNSKFGLINRRHHCRKCGKCVCAACAPNFVQLQGPGHRRSRLCTPCIRLMQLPGRVTGEAQLIQRAEDAEAEVRRLKEEAELKESAQASDVADASTISFGPRDRVESDQAFILEASRQLQKQLEEKERQLKDARQKETTASDDLSQATEVVMRLARGLHTLSSGNQGSTTPRGGPKAAIEFSGLQEALQVSEASYTRISESLYQLRSAQQKAGVKTEETKRNSLALNKVKNEVQEAREAITTLASRLHEIAGQPIDTSMRLMELEEGLETCTAALPQLEKLKAAGKEHEQRTLELNQRAADLELREEEVEARLLERASAFEQDQHQVRSAGGQLLADATELREKVKAQELALEARDKELQAKEAELHQAQEEYRQQCVEREQEHAEHRRQLEEQEAKLKEASEQHEQQMREREAELQEVDMQSEIGMSKVLSEVKWEEDASQCSICRKSLGKRNLSTSRRHHCRMCGKCVCSKCSPSEIQFEAGQGKQRVCNPCVLSTFSAPRTLSGSIHEGSDQ